MKPALRRRLHQIGLQLALPLALALPAQAANVSVGALDLTPSVIEASGLFGDFVDHIRFDLVAAPPRAGLFIELSSPRVREPDIDLLTTGIGGLLLELLDPLGNLLRSEFAVRSADPELFVADLRADLADGQGYVARLSGEGLGIQGGRYRLAMGLLPAQPSGDPPPAGEPAAVPTPGTAALVAAALALLALRRRSAAQAAATA